MYFVFRELGVCVPAQTYQPSAHERGPAVVIVHTMAGTFWSLIVGLGRNANEAKLMQSALQSSSFRAIATTEVCETAKMSAKSQHSCRK